MRSVLLSPRQQQQLDQLQPAFCTSVGRQFPEPPIAVVRAPATEAPLPECFCALLQNRDWIRSDSIWCNPCVLTIQDHAAITGPLVAEIWRNVYSLRRTSSYELAENLFAENVTMNRRSYKTQLTGVTPDATITGGIRWNMARRTFAF